MRIVEIFVVVHKSTKDEDFQILWVGLDLKILKHEDFRWPKSLVIYNCPTCVFLDSGKLLKNRPANLTKIFNTKQTKAFMNG